jgi:N-acetyl-1-D-myo-inositol-2-amino-2-deoxy-alpha-D-glucopyranoside deacetylase
VSRTLLLVHAHPDDEVLATGATIAHYAAEGVRVVLVTCTRGELGEIVVDDLKHLAASQEDRLGEHRVGELEEAARILGVAHGHFLGGEGRWRDSDMIGMPGNDDPRSFWQADVGEAADELATILRAERPQVVVTYDSNGGYGHPDHVKVHLVTHEAIRRAADSWDVPKVYECALPVSFVQTGIDLLAAAGRPGAFFGLERAEDMPFTVPDEQVTTVIDASAHAGTKRAAMLVHRSQIAGDDPLLMLTELLPEGRFGIEAYTIVKGGAVDAPETDLFAGLP